MARRIKGLSQLGHGHPEGGDEGEELKKSRALTRPGSTLSGEEEEKSKGKTRVIRGPNEHHLCLTVTLGTACSASFGAGRARGRQAGTTGVRAGPHALSLTHS